jgi:hypothetical protein
LTKIRANEKQLDHIIDQTDILQKIPNKFMAKYLVAELIYGRGELTGFSKPVECVRSYEEKLRQALNDSSDNFKQAENFYHKGKTQKQIINIKSFF